MSAPAARITPSTTPAARPQKPGRSLGGAWEETGRSLGGAWEETVKTGDGDGESDGDGDGDGLGMVVAMVMVVGLCYHCTGL